MATNGKYFKHVLSFSIFGILFLWLIQGLLYWSDFDIHFLGIYPRKLTGTVGIISSGFVHQNLIHLFSNTFPLLFLTIAIAYFYRPITQKLIPILYLLTGILVWLFGREAYHIGASGLVYSMIGFLLISGFVRNDPQSLGISLAFLFLYGGVLQGMFPDAVKGNVSWESHLLGAMVGGFCAYYYRNVKGPELLLDNKEDSDENGPDENNPTDFTGHGSYNYEYKSKD